jgi:hypothetical protein
MNARKGRTKRRILRTTGSRVDEHPEGPDEETRLANHRFAPKRQDSRLSVRIIIRQQESEQ